MYSIVYTNVAYESVAKPGFVSVGLLDYTNNLKLLIKKINIIIDS